MVAKNDKIAVALSGGKDSVALLFLMHKIFKDRRDIEISTITIDEGVTGYREHTLKTEVVS